MQTAHKIVASFIASKTIDMTDFHRWFQDRGYLQCEANIRDSRYLNLLETYVEERDAEYEATLPRILNKHIHGIAAGSKYIGRGSPWGKPLRHRLRRHPRRGHRQA